LNLKSPREHYEAYLILEKKYINYFKLGRPSRKEVRVEKGNRLAKIARELGISALKLFCIKKVYKNESKIPLIVSYVDTGKLSIFKAHMALKIVLREHKTEQDAITDIANLSNKTYVNKKSILPIGKQYMVKCPYCNQLLLSNKDVILRDRTSSKPAL